MVINPMIQGGCRRLVERLDYLGELTDIYSAYIEGYEKELNESRMFVYNPDFEEERGNRLYIPKFYNMYVMPFNKFNEPLMRNAVDLRIATIWCDNRTKERRFLNRRTNDYLLAHYWNLVTQMEGFNPILLYPDFKTGKRIIFRYSEKIAVDNSVAKEFSENDLWGRLIMSVGDTLSEL